MNKRAVYFLLFMSLSGCLSSARHNNNQVCFQKHCFDVEIVRTEEERARGLQHRTSLDKDAGMLFVFPVLDKYSFWMKETLIPLDMIWLDYARRVVDIAAEVPPCKSNPCPTYTPDQNALYVLEINADRANQLGIKVGDTAEFDFSTPGVD